MTPNAIGWEAPPLSTKSVDAAIRYRDGIAALVSGRADADVALAAAVALDPAFLLALVGLAVQRATRGASYSPPPVHPGVSRGERQHAEVVLSTFGDDHRHAADLRREHLVEYPGDLLIVWLPVLQLSAC
jgi:hypothetical protein